MDDLCFFYRLELGRLSTFCRDDGGKRMLPGAVFSCIETAMLAYHEEEFTRS